MDSQREVLDVEEIWNIMHAIAESGTSQSVKESSKFRNQLDSFQASGGGDFNFECGGEGEDESDGTEMAEAAEKLVQMGDSLTKKYEKKKDVDKIAAEIADYLLKKSETINDNLGDNLQFDLLDGLSMVDGWSVVYNGFKGRLLGFLSQTKRDGNEAEQISLVASVVKGVSGSLSDSSSHSVNLVTALGTSFLSENFGQYLAGRGLTGVVKEIKRNGEQ